MRFASLSLSPCAIASIGPCRLHPALRTARYASQLACLASAPVPVLAHRLSQSLEHLQMPPEAEHSLVLRRFRHGQQAAVVQSPLDGRQPERAYCVPVLAQRQRSLDRLRRAWSFPICRGCARIRQLERCRLCWGVFWEVCINPV